MTMPDVACSRHPPDRMDGNAKTTFSFRRTITHHSPSGWEWG